MAYITIYITILSNINSNNLFTL